ncbi:unnamed protein product [Rangifer tarandus platyrhynchus]|uniref:Uncharacterized protein n=1 Tax=Rangifer tarandus platyrhynchus TaxID=3082113 RepID=A0ABN8Z6I9_RANTA|nr:unnamed protein product [Rangifer tarandus platyrhynchus]
MGGFPIGAVLRTLRFHCRRHGFNPGQGAKSLHAVKNSQKTNKKKTPKGKMVNFKLCVFTHTKKNPAGTFLVAQWLRICLPMQGTQVQFLVQEDPTRCRADEPVCLQPVLCSKTPQ